MCRARPAPSTAPSSFYSPIYVFYSYANDRKPRRVYLSEYGRERVEESDLRGVGKPVSPPPDDTMPFRGAHAALVGVCCGKLPFARGVENVSSRDKLHITHTIHGACVHDEPKSARALETREDAVHRFLPSWSNASRENRFPFDSNRSYKNPILRIHKDKNIILVFYDKF